MPTLPQGSIVSTPRSGVHYIVTEYGAVNLKGKTTYERAKLLISVAHPDFRRPNWRKRRRRWASGSLPVGFTQTDGAKNQREPERGTDMNEEQSTVRGGLFDLTGCRAIVTGGTRGLGKAMARKV